jgi:prepilin-type N-terminal cleavage/methylation domain-containing protein
MMGSSYTQRGDTIVEVMIALIILASVLAGAFLLTNKSSNRVRTSQEHSEALQILQGQVELVRSLASTGNKAALLGASSDFCVVNNLVETGGPCENIDDLYTVSVNHDSACTMSQTVCKFNFVVTWDALDGGKNHEQLYYTVPFPS